MSNLRQSCTKLKSAIKVTVSVRVSFTVRVSLVWFVSSIASLSLQHASTQGAIRCPALRCVVCERRLRPIYNTAAHTCVCRVSLINISLYVRVITYIHALKKFNVTSNACPRRQWSISLSPCIAEMAHLFNGCVEWHLWPVSLCLF